MATAEATADQSKADADAAEATDARAQADFQRIQELRKQNTISQQEFDAAQAAVKEGGREPGRRETKGRRGRLEDGRGQGDLAATEAAVGMALAQWQEAQTNVESAQLDFSYTKIFAPCDGRVTRKSVEPGDYVQVGQTTDVHRADGCLGRRQFQGIAVEEHETRPAGAGGD